MIKLKSLLPEDEQGPAGANIKKRLKFELANGWKVFTVDGGEVRNQIEVEFVGGGHGEHKGKYDKCFVPPGEIWLEDSLDDKLFILIHEVVEYLLMKYRGIDYDHAHDIATKEEDETREAFRVDMPKPEVIAQGIAKHVLPDKAGAAAKVIMSVFDNQNKL